MVQITLSNICKQYGAVQVLSDVSVKISEGDRVGFIGHTGCGKTTLALILCGLLRPTSGNIEVSGNGNIVSGTGGHEFIRKYTRSIFQDPEAVFNPGLRIRTMFQEALLKTRGWDKSQAKQQCMEHFNALSLPKRLWDSYPAVLSYGQKARLNVLRSVLTDPRLLVADEPFVGMDVSTKKRVKEFIEKSVAQENRGLVLVTHDYSVLRELIDRVYVMAGGKVVDELTVNELFSRRDLGPEVASLMESQLLFSQKQPENPSV